MPLAHADLRSPVCTTVTCSDATPTRTGIVSGCVSSECAKALFDHCEHKCKYTRLDWGPEDWQLQPWDVFELPEVLGCAIASAPWVVSRSFPFTSIDHINIQEARAMKAALICQCRSHRGRKTFVNGIDSRACLGSWAKGRSSAPQLNSIWMQCLGYCILCEKRWVQFWLLSAANPSDDPSRHVPPRQPQPASPIVSRLITPGQTACGYVSRELATTHDSCLKFSPDVVVCRRPSPILLSVLLLRSKPILPKAFMLVLMICCMIKHFHVSFRKSHPEHISKSIWGSLVLHSPSFRIRTEALERRPILREMEAWTERTSETNLLGEWLSSAPHCIRPGAIFPLRILGLLVFGILGLFSS